MEEKDITQTGPLNYRDLQDANTLDYNKVNPKVLEQIKKNYEIMGSMSLFDPYKHSNIPMESQFAKTSSPFGQSRWDEDSVNEESFSHLQDTRANNQPWIAKLGASLAQGTVLAGTTFADGMAGLITGMGTSLARLTNLARKDDGTKYSVGESLAGIWDNEVSNGLQEINRLVEEVLPYYKTEDSEQGKWWKNMGSLDFWADGFLKNMGFTIGAMYSGMAWNKFLKGAKILKGSNTMGAKLTGSLFSAVNEGRIEANQNSYEMITKGMQILNNGYRDAEQNILNSTLSDNEKSVRLAELDENYKREIGNLEEGSKKMGNLDLALNIPLLAVDDFLMFGKMYARGFKNARNAAKKNIKKNIVQATEEASANEGNFLNKGIKKAKGSLGKYTWQKQTVLGALGKGALTGLREGNEELAQAMFSELATNRYSYDSPDAYYEAMTDPEAERKVMKTGPALAKAFLDTYGNLDRYEEFAIGALTGLFGVPTFGRVSNADAGTYLGRNRKVGLSGGIFGEVTTALEQNKRGQENVEWMNKLIDRAQNAKELMIQNEVFNNAMDGFSKENNKFEYLNSSDNDMFRSIQAFVSSGREQDLIDLIDEDFEHMSKEELVTRAGLTTPDINDKENQTGWKGATGATISSDDEIEKMRKDLIEKREQVKKDIKAFKNSINLVRNISNQSVNQSESEVNELAWLYWKTGKFKDRVFQIRDENEETFNKVYQGLVEFAKQLQNDLKEADSKITEIDYDNLSSTEAIVLDTRNQMLRKLNNKTAATLASVEEIMQNIMILHNANEDTMPMLRMLYEHNDEFIKYIRENKPFYENFVKGSIGSYDQFKKSVDTLLDLGKLSHAYNDFMDKFNEYQKNPIKLKRNRLRIDRKNKKKKQNIDKEEIRSKTLKVTKEQALSSDFDIDTAINNLGDTVQDLEAKKQLEDWNKQKKFGNAVEVSIAKQKTEALKNGGEPEEVEKYYDMAAEILHNAVKNAKDINELRDSTSELFLRTAEGTPITEDAVSGIIESVLADAKSQIDASADMAAKGNMVEQQLSKTQEPSQAAQKVAEEGQKEEKKDSQDPFNDIEVSDKGKPDNLEKPGRSETAHDADNTGIDPTGSTLKTDKKDEKKKEQQFKQEKGKNAIQHAAKTVAYKVAENLDYEGYKLNFPEKAEQIDKEKAEFETAIGPLSMALAQKIYDIIDKNEYTSIKDIMDVLSHTIEYENLMKSGYIDRDDPIKIAILTMLEDLNKKTVPANKTDDYEEDQYKNEYVDTIGSETEADTSATDSSSSGSYEFQKVLSPLRRATEEFVFGNLVNQSKKGEHVKFYETLKKSSFKRKVYETLYNFIADPNKHIFANRADVKEGDPIYFTVDETLLESMQKLYTDNKKGKAPFIVLMSSDPEGKNIVGDLAFSGEKSFEHNTYLKKLEGRIEQAYNKWKQNNPQGNFVYQGGHTSVAQCLEGRVLYTDSTNAEGDRSLNEIFASSQSENYPSFKLAIMIGNTVRATNRSVMNERSGIDSMIKDPKGYPKPGTPFVLVKTGAGVNKYVTVKFHMPKYSKNEYEGSMFNSWVAETVRRNVKNIAEASAENREKALVAFKTDLQKMFSHEFHINMNNDVLTISKKGSDGKYVIIHRKNFTENSSSSIIDDIGSVIGGLEVRINRSLINKGIEEGIEINGNKVPYNNIIGEKAHCNLARTTTTGDYFDAYPLNDNDQEIKIKKEQFPNVKIKNQSTVETAVSYNGETYYVSNDGIIKDADHHKVDILPEIEEIIEAKATIANSESAPYVSANNPDWFILPSGYLYCNSKGNEGIIKNNEEIKDITEKLKLGLDPLNEDMDTEEQSVSTTPVQEPVEKDEYPAFIKNNKMKAVYDILNTEVKDLISSKLAVYPDLKGTLRSTFNILADQFKGAEKDNRDEIESEIKNSIDSYIDSNTKYRREDSKEQEQINFDKEEKWLKSVLPQLDTKECLKVHKGLIKISNMKYPYYAWGMVKNGIITISDTAAAGTLYHEAFHSVVDTFLDSAEISTMYSEGAKKYGIERTDRNSELEIEEHIAEDFRKYVQKEEQPVIGFFTKIFRTIRHIVQSIFGKEMYLDNLFYRINRGKFKNMEISSSEDMQESLKYKLYEYTAEEKEILKNAPKNEKGQLLAPNGKVSNLTEKQYLQVRTKSFKEWFGDWEKINTFNIDNLDLSLVDYEIYNREKTPGYKNKAIKIFIKDKHEIGYFELVKDNEFGYFSVHFKTGNPDTQELYGSTKEERIILYDQLRKLIPDGAFVSTWGNVSDKGQHALDKVGKEYIKIGERQVEDRDHKNIIIPIYQKGKNNVSKIIDENGEPLVVYHGNRTDQIINKFDINKISTEHKSIFKNIKPFWFVKNKNIAKNVYSVKPESIGKGKQNLKYGEVIPVFLNIKNPIIDKQKGLVEKESIYGNYILKDESFDEFFKRIEKIISPNNDGAILTVEDGDQDTENLTSIQTQFIVFNPNNIKSAENNIGTFSTTDNDIRYRKTDLRPILKDQYKGKLIYAQSGTGKTAIADNINIIDSDRILANILGVEPALAIDAFRMLSPHDKIIIGEKYRNKIKEFVAAGKTVVTANNTLLPDADVIIYNESSDLTDARTNSDSRINKYVNPEYQDSTLKSIESMKDSGKEMHALNKNTYLGDIILQNPGFTNFNAKIATKTLDEAVTDFLDKFGLRIENDSDKESYFDAVHRVIHTSKTGRYTKGSGEAIAFMMQYNAQVKGLIIDMAKEEGKLTASDFTNGKIIKRAFIGLDKSKYYKKIGNAIDDQLEKFYAATKENKVTRFIRKVWGVIRDFFSIMDKNKYLVDKINDVASYIAYNTIVGNTGMIRGSLRKPGDEQAGRVYRVDLKKALDDFPYEREIVFKLADAGKGDIALAGSSAIATQGIVMRPKENPLHDLDFDTSYTSEEEVDKIVSETFENVQRTNTIVSEEDPGEVTYTYLTLNVPFHIGREIEGIAINTIYDENNQIIGSYVHSELTILKEGVKGKFLDFFTHQAIDYVRKYDPMTYNYNGHLLYVGNAKAAFEAKIRYDRLKDIWDFNRYMDNDMDAVLEYRENKVAYENLSNENIESLNRLGISPDQYDLLDTAEKENLLHCMY